MFCEEIQKITEQIRRALKPKRIYLFGSFAKGTDQDDSDYDFYVVVPDHAGLGLSCLRKHTNPSVGSGNARWTS